MYPPEQFWIRVADAHDPTNMAALGIEDAGQEAFAPVQAGRLGPADQPLDGPDLVAAATADGHDAAAGLGGLGKGELGAVDANPGQVAAGSVERLLVHQGQLEARRESGRPIRPPVAPLGNPPIAAD